MKEEELHYIIEQQDYENKQRIWKKVVESLSKTYPLKNKNFEIL